MFTGIAAHQSFSANLSFKHEALSGEGVVVSDSGVCGEPTLLGTRARRRRVHPRMPGGITQSAIF